jgi:transposase
MPTRKRARIEPTDDWHQLRLLTKSAEQLAYEMIRPVVLFGHSPAERARATGKSERTIHRQAERFDEFGMASLFERGREGGYRSLPPPMRQFIVDLKAEHQPFRPNEIATICYVRFGRRPSPHTVQRALADGPPPSRKTRRYPRYHEIPDAYDRRHAIVALHSEGWSVKSIASYLGVSRPTVYDTLRRWIEDGVAGIEPRDSAPIDHARKVDLRAIAEVRKLQENPELGEFRIHAALKQIGIFLSPRTCGRILALNRKLYGLRKPSRAPREPKAMPFAPSRRHQYWTVDIRYIDNDHLGYQTYCICILENYSRAILASGLSRQQDLSAYLMILYSAIRQHGSPEALVSDGGSVFRAKQATRIYKALGIAKEKIEKRQPWQSYIETGFNVQRRMADWHFAQAHTWEELVAGHEKWVADYNYQVHWAHRQRTDGRQCPAEVLGWVHGSQISPEELHRVFYSTRFGRRIDALGYVRFRHWRVYGEEGLPGRDAAVWLYNETLSVEFAGQPLSRYQVRYEPDRKHLRGITRPKLFETRYRSIQPHLWELGEDQWLKVFRVPEYAPRKHRPAVGVQEPLSIAAQDGV